MNEFEQESHECSLQKRARRAFVLIKLKLFKLFLNDRSFLLDKTLIHRLLLFKALWSCTETLIWTSNHLVPIEVLYVEKILIKNLIKKLINWRKKDMGILDDMGVIKLKVNYSFNKSIGLFKEKNRTDPKICIVRTPQKTTKKYFMLILPIIWVSLHTIVVKWNASLLHLISFNFPFFSFPEPRSISPWVWIANP